jgi:hypothetical protein
MKTTFSNPKQLKQKTMKNSILKFALATVLVAGFTSCEDDDAPVLINEEELITTVTYTLTNNADSNDVVEFKSFDSDGDGPLLPTTTNGTLRANATYSGSITFLNETDPNDIDNITDEVQEEADEHEVFYATPVAGIVITKTDTDPDGNPLGLRTTLQTGAAGSGNLVVTLIHEPTKPNTGTVSNAGGEPDAEVTFTITVQ